MNNGIDYGGGITNIDAKTGIRYGVISIHEVTQAWCDSAEPVCEVYCPHCGNYMPKGFDAKRCGSCYKKIEDGDLDGIEPNGWEYVGDGYILYQSQDDPDIFVIKSPFYTLCSFCSPCAPGAGYLMTPGTVKTYCLGHDWFEEKAPYKVYNIKTDDGSFA
jgi:hypothetical protein